MNARTPTISGTRQVDRILTANPGSWTSGTDFACQWYASGRAISQATGKSVTLTRSQRGGTIRVKVTGRLSGYATVPKASTASARVR